MRRLTDSDIEEICKILDGWSEKLTWNALLDAVEQRLGRRYTRQALDRHTRIKLAYSTRKRSLRDGPKPPGETTVEMQKALERIERLKAENERLKAENNQLLSQFVRWAYNAHARGLSEDYLNQQLPPIDRDPTRLHPREDG